MRPFNKTMIERAVAMYFASKAMRPVKTTSKASLMLTKST